MFVSSCFCACCDTLPPHFSTSILCRLVHFDTYNYQWSPIMVAERPFKPHIQSSPSPWHSTTPWNRVRSGFNFVDFGQIFLAMLQGTFNPYFTQDLKHVNLFLCSQTQDSYGIHKICKVWKFVLSSISKFFFFNKVWNKVQYVCTHICLQELPVPCHTQRARADFVICRQEMTVWNRQLMPKMAGKNTCFKNWFSSKLMSNTVDNCTLPKPPYFP